MSSQRLGARKQRSRAEWCSLLARHSRSELTVAGFCQKEGICPASFYRWQALLGKGHESDALNLAGVKQDFVDLGPLDLSSRPNPHLEIKLDLGGGLVLHLVRS